MLIEGKNPVKETLNSTTTVEKLFVSKSSLDPMTQSIVDIAKSKKIKINFVDKYLLDKLSNTGKHQGVLCFTTEYSYVDIDEILNVSREKGSQPFIVLLDGIEDPHNLGAIMRSCECAGVDGIIIPKNRAVGVNDTVVKISQGASQFVKVAQVTNINDAIKYLKDQFINVYCADMDGEMAYSARFDEAIALVIGGEGLGVKRLTKSLCDKVLSIPMYGNINSLNASNAAAIMIYEVIRQRLGKV